MKTKEGLASNHRAEKRLLVKLFMLAILFFISSEVANQVFEKASRRLCNLTYILNQLFVVQSALVVTYFLDRVTLDHSSENMIVKIINMHQFGMFVAACLTCGAFNLLFHTLHKSFAESLFLLYLYFLIPPSIFFYARRLIARLCSK